MSNRAYLSHPKYRRDIDGLRGLAVLMVVLFHAFPSFVRGGFIGVDIFFVISGFLITTIINENLKLNHFSFLEFYSRRVMRIFPALLIVLITIHIFGWFTLSSGEYKQLGKHIAGGSGFISNFIFWNESGYFDNSAESKPLLHLWSLGIEEQFYIFCPLILFAAFKLKISIGRIIALGLLLSFSINIGLAQGHPTADFYFPIARFWEILVGGALALLAQIKVNKRVFLIKLSDFFSGLGFTLLVIGLVVIDKNTIFPGWHALLPVIGAALIIYAGSTAFLNKLLLSNKLAVFLGVISFPLYLVHWPLLTFWRLNSVHEIEGYVYIGIIAASIFLSWLIYALVEVRIRQRRSTGVTLFLILGMVIVGSIGFNCYQREGMPFRKVVQQKFNFDLKNANGQTGCLNILSEGQNLCVPLSKNIKAQRPLIVVWGDSHASHLNAGLLDLMHSQKFSFIDFSYSACPPILSFKPRGLNSGAIHENEVCLRRNEDAFEAIKKYQPETVVLSANWMQYDGLNQFNELKDLEIEKTVNRLKGLNIKNIVLIGNFPVYYIDQPRIASTFFLPDLTNRSYSRFNYASINANQRMGKFAKAHNLIFISPLDDLCDKDGCLLSVSDSFLTPMGLDESHLTKDGSTYYIKYLSDKNKLNIN